MNRLFDSIRVNKPKLNKFDLSHEKKLSMRQGQLVPVLVQEVVPGDRFRVKTESLVRFAPMLSPMMHRVDVIIEYFYVPNRIMWDEWENFITGGREGISVPAFPKLEFADANIDYLAESSLADYMGLPSVGSGETFSENLYVSALPFRAYQMVYDAYYRDQNVTPSIDVLKVGGIIPAVSTENGKLNSMRYRCWAKGYFESALPWAQRGGQVEIPVVEPEVTYKAVTRLFNETSPGSAPTGGLTATPHSIGGDTGSDLETAGSQDIRLENIESIQATPTSINDLRRAIRLQEWLELAARAGGRYVEHLLAFFGVKSSDARLQRPEWLGGGRVPIVVSEVLSTFQSPDGDGSPQGDMAGHGIAVGQTQGFSRRFEEHGYVIGIMSVMPKATYQQGVPRHFSRILDKYQYYFPQFAHLGEQEILQQEIFYDTSAGTGNAASFGYQSRYADYKYGCNSVHGAFRSSLAFWHLGRIFASAPGLSTGFLEASDLSDRVFAVDDQNIDNIYVQLYHHFDALRPMPYFGTPSI